MLFFVSTRASEISAVLVTAFVYMYINVNRNKEMEKKEKKNNNYKQTDYTTMRHQLCVSHRDITCLAYIASI